jgi:hypothetical protein
MTDCAPARLFCWNFQTDEGAWEKGWGGYARPDNLHPMDEKERRTGGIYYHEREVEGLRARLAEAEAERDKWRAQAEATAREAQACFDAQSEIDEAWDQIGTRGNKAHLSLPEQLAVLFRDHEATEAKEATHD